MSDRIDVGHDEMPLDQSGVWGETSQEAVLDLTGSCNLRRHSKGVPTH